MKQIDPREAAALVVGRVREGGSLNRELPKVLRGVEVSSQPAAQALSYGVLRQFELIDALLGRLLKKPFKRKDQAIADRLSVALFELIEQSSPDYAVVDAAVKSIKKQRSWASGLANAVLRRFLREREQLLDAVRAQNASARYLLPSWLLQSLQSDYPDQWEAIARESAAQAPMTLRVNLSRISREDYLARCSAQGIQARAHETVATAVVLERPVDVVELPGFEDGEISVQDAAAQLAGWLMDVQPGERILDACAAPGGKTVHLLETVDGNAEIVAVEADAERIDRLEENLERSGYSAALIVADAADTANWWDGAQFDRILLDAPCSATGVIRRHPDIKRHRQPDDISELVELQRHLLHRLWPLLKPGGRLIYATCSVLTVENLQQICEFLDTVPDASWHIDDTKGRFMRGEAVQILPGEQAMDGFFYACLRKSV